MACDAPVSETTEVRTAPTLTAPALEGLLAQTHRSATRALAAYRKAPPAQRATARARAEKLLGLRQQILAQVLVQNPDAALHHLLGDADRATATTIAAQAVEKRVTVKGSLDVVVGESFERGGHVDRFLVKTASGERIALQPSQAARTRLLAGASVTATGYRLGADLLVDEQGLTAVTAEPPNPDTHGTQNVMVVLANYLDTPQPELGKEQVRDVVFNQTDAYYQEVSYGKTDLAGDVIGYYQLDIAHTCDLFTIRDSVIRAVDADVDFLHYDRLVIVVPSNGCSAAGWGTIGKASASTAEGEVMLSTSWIWPEYTDLRVVSHELGHNLGLHHANMLGCEYEPIYSPRCQQWEYGDGYDAMGYRVGHFNAPHKAHLGWIGVTDVTADGTFTIPTMEASTDQPQALRIPRGDWGDALWVEYRQPFGYDAGFEFSNVYRGALLHIAPGQISTLLVDPTPPSWSDESALEVGQSFMDPKTGAIVTVTAQDPDALTVDVSLGHCSDDAIAPIVTMTSPARDSLVSGTVTLRAEASDASGIGSVEFYSSLSWDTPFAVVSEPPYEASIDTFKMPNGYGSFWVKANDNRGKGCEPNSSSDYVWVQVENIDTVPPSVAIVAPKGQVVHEEPFYFAADASDDHGVAFVELYLDPMGSDPCEASSKPPFCKDGGIIKKYSEEFSGKQGGPARAPYLLAQTDRGSPYEAWTKHLKPGQYKVWAVAYDYAGNRTVSASKQFSVSGRPNR